MTSTTEVGELLQEPAPAPMTIQAMAHGTDGVARLEPVLAMPTGTPGLVVVPTFHNGEFTGEFALAHTRSGYLLPGQWGDASPETCLRTAVALATVGIDWTGNREEVQAAAAANKEAVVKAIRDGAYPPAEADGPDAPTDPDTVAPYPRTEAQATADMIARHIARSARIRQDHGFHEDDSTNMRRYHRIGGIVSDWALVYVLREFARVDQMAADYTARQLWHGWEDGSTPSEMLFEWGQEYGFPDVAEDTPEVEERPIVTGDAQVLDPTYGGSITGMRRQILQGAERCEARYQELTPLVFEGNPTDERAKELTRDHLIAHFGAHYGHALADVLGLLSEVNPWLAQRAAQRVVLIGNDGGGNEDLYPDATPAVADQPGGTGDGPA